MVVRVVSYNIQYGVGLDGLYDIARVAAAVADADIILLQEVTRMCPWNGGQDMAAALEEALPGHFSVYHPACDVDLGSAVEAGRAINRRFQFGNMVLSRFPIVAARGHLLPRTLRPGGLNLQRGALEATVAAPDGPLRVISVHLDHIGIDERLMQIGALRDLALEAPARGGALTGTEAFGMSELPMPDDVLIGGDFNCEPGSGEYAAMIADGAFVDLTADDAGWSWTDPKDRSVTQRLDHVFATPGLAGLRREVTVDRSCVASDHMPVWLALG